MKTTIKFNFKRYLANSKSAGEYVLKRQDLIKRFIISTSGDGLKNFSNQNLSQLYDNLGLSKTSLLTLVIPSNLTPYEYHSTYNADTSYINQPRLSVTKLLTNRWCELKEYYNIYSNSPPLQPTKQIELGLIVHHRLEMEAHRPIDTDRLQVAIAELEKIKLGAGKKIDPLFDINILEGRHAEELSERVMMRIFSLFRNSESREVLVHGFINLRSHDFVQNSEKLSKPGNVLVSGIIDKIRLLNLSNPDDFSLFQEIEFFFKSKFPKLNNEYVINLSIFFDEVRKIICRYSDDFSLQITDIKTRSISKVPSQESVISAAKMQTFYYRKFLGILSGEDGESIMGYKSLAENLAIKNCRLDVPISYKTLLILLRKNFELLYDDFKRLANGHNLGLKSFDDYARLHYSADAYDLSNFLEENDINILNCYDDQFDYSLLKDLIKKWKYPLTLRYFAARSSQFYNLIGPLVGNNTTIEYHNNNSGECFHVDHYLYSYQDIEEEVGEACRFWNGERAPKPNTDITKCKYCDFRSRCPIPNSIVYKREVGSRVHDFVNSDQ
ncbi:uncharacterized protein PRCAT00001673001 [Priceomyces carsonii]|uniref:uncharacterized protein n=1 Tax=Priceomyces carsonii TaxID=28549 RepID=UPI002ED88C8D|nr:unnamed protein product [Priceomyces carsonii]